MIIWCTGFKASLNHLKSIDIVERDNFVEVQNGRSIKLPNLMSAEKTGGFNLVN